MSTPKYLDLRTAAGHALSFQDDGTLLLDGDSLAPPLGTASLIPTIQTTDYQAVKGDFVLSAAPITVTTPVAPKIGDSFGIAAFSSDVTLAGDTVFNGLGPITTVASGQAITLIWCTFASVTAWCNLVAAVQIVGSLFLEGIVAARGVLKTQSAPSVDRNTLDDGAGNATLAGVVDVGPTNAKVQVSNSGSFGSYSSRVDLSANQVAGVSILAVEGEGGLVRTLDSVGAIRNVLDDGAGNASIAGGITADGEATLRNGLEVEQAGVPFFKADSNSSVVESCDQNSMGAPRNTLDDGAGNVILRALSSSDPHVVGQLYTAAGVLMVSAG